MIPMNLGQRGLRVGLPQILASQQQQPAPQANPAPVQSNQARDYGVAQALSQPIQVQSGGWGEALAEAVASGLQGRIARRDRQHELDALAGEQKQESAQRNAISDALANFDPSQPNNLVEGLRTAAPEQALDLATALARQGQGEQEQWSEPFAFEHGMAQRNLRTGQVRVLSRPPAPLLGYMMPPDSNDWDYSE